LTEEPTFQEVAGGDLGEHRGEDDILEAAVHVEELTGKKGVKGRERLITPPA